MSAALHGKEEQMANNEAHTPDAEALFTAIEYAVLRKAHGHDRGELEACKDTLLMHMRERAALLGAAKAVAFSNGFDAALPEKMEALRAAIAAATNGGA